MKSTRSTRDYEVEAGEVATSRATETIGRHTCRLCERILLKNHRPRTTVRYGDDVSSLHFSYLNTPVAGFDPTPIAPLRPTYQGSFDELGTPLAEVTFVVLDLETTGASANNCEITEIGAIKVRGGEYLGRFDTLINPGVAIPPMITLLTHITEAMVVEAPRIEHVLPQLLEFIGGAVIVGHNVRFDISFIDAACERFGYPRLSQRRVDTLSLARRLIRDEVENLKLGTLARHLRVPTSPSHRAMADAEATTEVLHALIERAAAFGVLGLDDLLALPTMRAHPSASKLDLTASLPRSPGVYVFRDSKGEPLYVGKASNLRARVRSYFASDTRRKVPQMLRETVAIDHVVCADALEAAVREVRLIHELTPRFNRQLKTWKTYSYLKLKDGPLGKLTVTRIAKPDGCLYLGPFSSSSAAHGVREAIELAVPAVGLGNNVSQEDVVAMIKLGLTSDPELLLRPLWLRMTRLADEQRYEEAAVVRDRLSSLERTFDRRERIDALRLAPLTEISTASRTIELRYGRLIITDGAGATDITTCVAPVASVPPERHEIDELLAVARHIAKLNSVAVTQPTR